VVEGASLESWYLSPPFFSPRRAFPVNPSSAVRYPLKAVRSAYACELVPVTPSKVRKTATRVHLMMCQAGVSGSKPDRDVMRYLKSLAVKAGAAAAITAMLIPGISAAESYDPNNFGEVTSVIGGAPSPLGNFPATVALLRVSSTSNLFNRQFCGGTAISDSYILTAAHCMYQTGQPIAPSDFTVAGNFVDLGNDSPAEFAVAEIIVHPNYDDNDINAENDIALLRLTQSHNFPIIQLFNGDARKLTGVTAAVAGWGATDNNGNFPTLMQEAFVPITDLDVCSSVYQGGINDVHICAGFQQGGVDACAGDSGGPLMINAASGLIQVGITSFGNGCALPNAYGVYSNVEHYDDWVASIVPAPSTGSELFTSPVEFAKDDPSNPGVTPAPAPAPGGSDPSNPTNPSNPTTQPVVTPDDSGFSGAVGGPMLWLLFVVAAARTAASRSSRLFKLAGVGALMALLTGCATELAAISETDDATRISEGTVKNALAVDASSDDGGQPMFDGAALTQKREVVLAAASERYGMEPVCEGKKVAPRNSRRADFYERCDYMGVNASFDSATLTDISYHFMSAQLVQIDAKLAGSAVAMAPLADSLDKVLGESEFTSAAVTESGSELPQAIYHWMKTPDLALARLRTAAAADDESFVLTIQHPRVTDSIDELPAL